jgi:hypothetical protein
MKEPKTSAVFTKSKRGWRKLGICAAEIGSFGQEIEALTKEILQSRRDRTGGDHERVDISWPSGAAGKQQLRTAHPDPPNKEMAYARSESSVCCRLLESSKNR